MQFDLKVLLTAFPGDPVFSRKSDSSTINSSLFSTPLSK